MKNKIKTLIVFFFTLTVINQEVSGMEILDVKDKERAIEIKSWKEKQAKVTDAKRFMIAGFGSDILVEKETNFKIGTHPYKKNNDQLIELRIIFNKKYTSYILGSTDTCPDSSFKILDNQPSFTYLVNSCFYKNKRGEEDNSYTYIIFDKRKNTAATIETTSSNRAKEPTLTLSNVTYKYRWSGPREDGKKINVAFDFKINSSTDVVCTKSWNDECASPLEKK